MALIPVLRRQRQVDFYEFNAGLVCRVNFRTGSKDRKKSCLKKLKVKKNTWFAGSSKVYFNSKLSTFHSWSLSTKTKCPNTIIYREIVKMFLNYKLFKKKLIQIS